MADAGKPAITVRLYRFRNRLKDKTAGLGASSAEIDSTALANAEALFAEMAEDYPDWVQSILVRLGELHARCVDSPDQRRALLEQIARIAHDLKGQGGTFGYPLITTFAAALHKFADHKGAISDNHVEIIKAHIDAMRAVIRERVKGDGGEIGVALTRGLEAVIAKYR